MKRMREIAARMETAAIKTLVKKEEGFTQVIEVLVLIAVIVAVCVIFKSQISSLMSSIFSTLTSKITELFS